MAAIGGPRTVTDGLVLELDVANSKSYGPSSVEVLLVGGGGGGGMDMGGGGGGGGVISNSSVAVTAGVPITVTVGAGGNGAPAGSTSGQPASHQFTISATQGGNSVFGSLTAIGGGFGASSYYGYLPNSGIGGTGGSGGGCSAYTHGGERYVDNNNTAGQGFPGGNSGNPTTGADDHYSGGGGGAGARGTSGPGHTSPSGARADGGIGVLNTIMGVPYYWAGGGGGSCYSHTQGGNGGLGGGGGGAAGGNGNTVGVGNTSGINPSGNGGLGNNQPGGNGGTNTGGGGGGGSHYNANNKGGDGGSGIVIIRYPGPQKATGGTITTVGGSTIHTFTTSGTFTPAGANTLHDLSGNGYSGAITNGPTYNSSNGGSLVFTGTSTQINTSLMGTWVPDGSVGYSTMTIDIWVKLTSTAGWIYTRPFNGSGQYNVWITPAYFWINAISGASQINFARNIYDGTWTNITCWANSTQMGYYINGGQYSDSKAHGITGGVPSAGNYVNSSLMSWLYAYGAGDTHTDCAAGNLSSFKFYSRVLTAAEVKQNFNAIRGRYGI